MSATGGAIQETERRGLERSWIVPLVDDIRLEGEACVDNWVEEKERYARLDYR